MIKVVRIKWVLSSTLIVLLSTLVAIKAADILLATVLPIDPYIAYQNTLNEEIRKVSLANNVPFIDLDEQISGKSSFFYDEVHLTDSGSIKAAQIIADSLKNI